MVDGSLVISTDGSVSGMVNGDVHVTDNARAIISGMIAGDVLVDPGAHAIVSGMVSGRVVGDAVVTGMVKNR